MATETIRFALELNTRSAEALEVTQRVAVARPICQGRGEQLQLTRRAAYTLVLE